MKSIGYFAVLAIVAGSLFSSCSKEEVPSGDDTKDEVKLEGELYTSWTIPYEDLSNDQKASYTKIDLTVFPNDDFEWVLYGKNGQTYTMTGALYAERSNYTHSNDAGIWNIRFNITRINGYDMQGAYYGIYTYGDENHLIVNVEPDVQSWGDHPTAQKGIGSGMKGMNTVYNYSKRSE